MLRTNDYGAFGTEEFLRIAQDIQDDILAEIYARGIPRDHVEREEYSTRRIVLHKTVLHIMWAKPKNPSRFLDLIQIQVDGKIPAKDQRGVFHAGVNDPHKKDFRPLKKGFNVGKIVDYFLDLAEKTRAATAEKEAQEKQVEENRQASTGIERRLVDHFGLTVHSSHYEDDGVWWHWGDLLEPLNVIPCDWYPDKVVVKVDYIALRRSAYRLSHLVDLAARLQVEPLIHNSTVDAGIALSFLLTEEEAKTVIPVLIDTIGPLLDREFHAQDYPELREFTIY